MTEPETDVLIIGAGAAGMLAAVSSAQSGVQTLVIERNKWPGVKLSITGKGKCNITNIAGIDEFIWNFGKNGRYLKPVFYNFFNNQLLDLLSEAGIPSKAERGGRVFPLHEDSRELVHRLSTFAVLKGARFLYNSRCISFEIENNKITAVHLEDGRVLHPGVIIMATGGASYPATGSTGDGYKFAGSGGHSIINPCPALVPLETSVKFPVSMINLTLNNININVYSNGKKTGIFGGEMKFREYGIDGPAVLSLSRMIAEELASGKTVTIAIDLKPALDDQVLDQRLLKEIQTNKQTTTGKMMETLLPSGMVSWFLQFSEVPYDKKCHEINSNDRKKIRFNLKNLPLQIVASRPFAEAIITRGGVSVKEIDFQSMKSKIISNLFIAGEVIDIDAETGGYNLQAAFSTGWVAGKNAAAQVLKEKERL